MRGKDRKWGSEREKYERWKTVGKEEERKSKGKGRRIMWRIIRSENTKIVWKADVKIWKAEEAHRDVIKKEIRKEKERWYKETEKQRHTRRMRGREKGKQRKEYCIYLFSI